MFQTPPPPPPPPAPPPSQCSLKVTAEKVPPMSCQPESGRMAWCATSTYPRDQIIGRCFSTATIRTIRTHRTRTTHRHRRLHPHRLHRRLHPARRLPRHRPRRRPCRCRPRRRRALRRRHLEGLSRPLTAIRRTITLTEPAPAIGLFHMGALPMIMGSDMGAAAVPYGSTPPATPESSSMPTPKIIASRSSLAQALTRDTQAVPGRSRRRPTTNASNGGTAYPLILMLLSAQTQVQTPSRLSHTQAAPAAVFQLCASSLADILMRHSPRWSRKTQHSRIKSFSSSRHWPSR